MKKKIILKESQLRKLLEMRVNDFTVEDITQKLESIECSGADLKNLVKDILKGYGYEHIKVLFLGHDKQTHDLIYTAHTEGPIIVYKTKSEVSNDQPCLTIYDVKVYKEI